nr:MAG TPA: hypothetical protein [Caudoviricetes sp.]
MQVFDSVGVDYSYTLEYNGRKGGADNANQMSRM